LESSQLARIKIKAASSAIDCQRWLDEERLLCQERIEELETRHLFEIKKLTTENETLLKEKHDLKLAFDEFVADSKKWSVSYSNIGIGFALGIVSSIVVINAIKK
jgi:type I site-specific restriction-modification system R (restriction) subunit